MAYLSAKSKSMEEAPEDVLDTTSFGSDLKEEAKDVAKTFKSLDTQVNKREIQKNFMSFHHADTLEAAADRNFEQQVIAESAVEEYQASSAYKDQKQKDCLAE